MEKSETHAINITIETDEAGVVDAHLTISGDIHRIAQAICGLIQTNLSFRQLIFEALLNSIGKGDAGVKVTGYTDNNEKRGGYS